MADVLTRLWCMTKMPTLRGTTFDVLATKCWWWNIVNVVAMVNDEQSAVGKCFGTQPKTMFARLIITTFCLDQVNRNNDGNWMYTIRRVHYLIALLTVCAFVKFLSTTSCWIKDLEVAYLLVLCICTNPIALPNWISYWVRIPIVHYNSLEFPRDTGFGWGSTWCINPKSIGTGLFSVGFTALTSPEMDTCLCFTC